MCSFYPKTFFVKLESQFVFGVGPILSQTETKEAIFCKTVFTQKRLKIKKMKIPFSFKIMLRKSSLLCLK
jgi:hypothetical protein